MISENNKYLIEHVILVFNLEGDGGHGEGVRGGRHLQQEPHHLYKGEHFKGTFSRK
jgi:hypothetical protein